MTAKVANWVPDHTSIIPTFGGVKLIPLLPVFIVPDEVPEKTHFAASFGSFVIAPVLVRNCPVPILYK